jgi:hypothetical protein
MKPSHFAIAPTVGATLRVAPAAFAGVIVGVGGARAAPHSR